MAKVVTSEGLQDFVSTGKPTEVISGDATSRAAAAKAALDTKLAKTDSPAEPVPESNTDSKSTETNQTGEVPRETNTEEGEPDDLKGIPLSEAAQKRLDKWIAKRTKQTKDAQAEAATAREEAESDRRMAEQLFNERELWRQRAEAAEKRAPKPEEEKPTAGLTKPDPQTYYDDKGQFRAIEYAEALAEYSAKKAVAEDRQTQADENAKRAKEAADAVVRERIQAATQKYPDWQKVVSGSEIQLQNDCLAYIAESEYGMDIAYFLAKNPKEAERIRKLSPKLAVGELGKLQTQFEKPPQKAEQTTKEPTKVTQTAPEPITPISTSGSGSIVVDPAKMDFKQLRQYHRDRRKNGLER